MSEEVGGGAESGEGIDAVALGAAMRNGSSAVDAELTGYLSDQRHHMKKQFRMKLWELRLGVLLRIATAFTGLAIAAGLAFLIWNAAQSNDLVIDSFQVPPELAAKGLSGPVIAAKLSDKIATMQTETTSARPPKSYANGLSDGLKLEIPETGVSLSELDRFLRAKLGHDLHIGGEMALTEKGIALTARAGNDSATVTGAETDMDALLQKLAEQVYRTTQPYRYANWLNSKGRVEESVAILKLLAASGPLSERAWAVNGLAIERIEQENDLTGLALLRRGLVLDPNHYLLASNIANVEARLGRVEESLRHYQMAEALLAAHGPDYAATDQIASRQHGNHAMVLRGEGALLEAVQEFRQTSALVAASGGALTFSGASSFAETLARLHEPGAASQVLADRQPLTLNSNLGSTLPGLAIAVEEQNWPGVLAGEKEFVALSNQWPGLAKDMATLADPQIALALAHLGRFAEAEARLRPMPGDCYECLIARGQVASLERQDARADYWFDRAVKGNPSIPFAYFEWGKALMQRGDLTGAIAKFKIANQKGPHFADPLEMWGEVLIAQNRSDLAIAKFTEANKYAPNWGGLHLKWGEALSYLGKTAEAQKQFARAGELDLAAAEKIELAKVSK